MQADWDAEFAKYQMSPEFQKVNSRMTLDEFKFIYWCSPPSALLRLSYRNPPSNHPCDIPGIILEVDTERSYTKRRDGST